MRRRSRVDGNQSEVVALFRKLGCSVRHTHTLPDGGGDIVVGKNGHNVLVEIKDPDIPPNKRKLTEKEQEFIDGWRGRHEIVMTEQDVFSLVESLSGN